MSASRVMKAIALGALALVSALAVSFTIRPQLRAALLAELHDPADLPALATDPRVHFELRARACAQIVAAILPAAIARIESEHGRPFAGPPIVGVYDDESVYSRANGLGDPDVVGVSRAGRAMLSPVLCKNEISRLTGVLMHELSHVHFFGWRPRGTPRPPQWFTEGLAVMASDGGAAESVSDKDAAQAIRNGFGVILDPTPWGNFLAIPFAADPPCDAGCDARSFRQRLAYRQAAIFVAWLRKRDPNAFLRLMRELEGGADFDPAFKAAFGGTPWELWKEFSAGLQAAR